MLGQGFRMTTILPTCHTEKNCPWRGAESIITAPSLGIASFDVDSVEKLAHLMIFFHWNYVINAF